MSGLELQRWWIFYNTEPFGEYRADIRMAIQTAALINMWASHGSLLPRDFLPDFYRMIPKRRRNEPKTRAQIRSAFLLMTRLAGGSIPQEEHADDKV